jgi:hypothetical protein
LRQLWVNTQDFNLFSVSVSIDQMRTKKFDPSNFLFLGLKLHEMSFAQSEQNFKVFCPCEKVFLECRDF